MDEQVHDAGFMDWFNRLFGNSPAPENSPVPVPAPPPALTPLIDEKMLREAIQNEFPRFKVQEGGVHGRSGFDI